MATYYVRQSGNDSNAGTSPSAAWRTVSKALGASGIGSGDTVWIGAGRYHEVVTPAMTSAVAETFVKGDITGVNTGDAGEVYISGYVDGWNDGSYPRTLSLNGRDNLTFEDLGFLGYQTVYDPGFGARYIKFKRCYIFGDYDGVLIYSVNQATPFDWTFERCVIIGAGSDAVAVALKSATAGSADTDINLDFTDCLLMGCFASASLYSNDGSLGTTWKQGGATYTRCTTYGAMNCQANCSTTLPVVLTDCVCYGGVTATSLGMFSDAGGNAFGILSNVTQAAGSRLFTGDRSMFFPFSMGHESYLWGLTPRHPFSPLFPGTTIGIGTAPTADISGRSSSDGSAEWLDGGTATAGSATTLTDSSKAWSVDQHRGKLVRLASGTGGGQIKHISGNTATVLTIGGKSGDWHTAPDATSVYMIYESIPVETGKATAGAASTLTDGGAAWSTDQWSGYTVEIVGGTGVGQSASILSNSGTVLTRSGTWSTNPDNTSVYVLYRGANTGVQAKYPGAFQRHDTAKVQTTMLNGGATGFVLDGYASQEFIVPVLPGSTTVSVPLRYDSYHGATNKPQVSVVADGALGITATTSTMSAAVDTWETVAVTFTATKQGLARIRVQSRSGTPYGRLFIDGGAWRFGSAYGQRSTQFQLRPRTG